VRLVCQFIETVASPNALLWNEQEETIPPRHFDIQIQQEPLYKVYINRMSVILLLSSTIKIWRISVSGQSKNAFLYLLETYKYVTANAKIRFFF